MNLPMLQLAKALFVLAIFVYWHLESKLINHILEHPLLTRWQQLAMALVNTAVTLGAFHLSQSAAWLVAVLLLLMLVEFTILYRDSDVQGLFCALASVIHVLAIRIGVVGLFAIATGLSSYQVVHQEPWFFFSQLVTFVLLDLALAAVLFLLPLDSVRIVSSHKEHRWFMIAWMLVNVIYLFLNAATLDQPSFTSSPPINQIVAPLSILIGLYIVLFFAFKTSQLLGYKQKTTALQQAVAQELQYRSSITKDALLSYEINVTKNLVVSGVAEPEREGKTAVYSALLDDLAHNLVYHEDVAEFVRVTSVDNLQGLFAEGKTAISLEYRRLLPTGKYAWVRTVVNLVKDGENGDLIAYACVKDIDEEKRRQIDLKRKAERDPLTGLYNKEVTAKLINEQLAYECNTAGSALFMIDVDYFKNVNDHLGHVYGDAVLCELADKLQGLFRADDIVGRIGGDEFIAYMKSTPSFELVVERAEDILKAFRLSYKGGQQEKCTLSGSVGISLFPKDGGSFALLYQHADVALYRAKNQGRDSYAFYDGSDFTGYTAQRTEIETRGSLLQRSFRSNRIEYVFKILYESDSSVEAIYSVLELVASHFSFERGYIFETSKDGKFTSNTFEWCAEGVSPQIDNLQHQPIAVVETANKSFYKSGMFVIHNLDHLQPIEREVLEPQGIKSMFQFGIFDKSNLLGFIGFDNCRNETLPGSVEIDEIATICNLLATFFVKQYIDRVSEEELTLFQEIMDHLESFIYVVNIQTFEVLFMNERTRKLMPVTGSADPCYRFFRGRDCQCADCPVRQLSEGGAARSSLITFNDKLGIWIEVTATPLRWRDGSITALINCADITQQKQESIMHIDKLEKLAYQDEVTGGLSYHKFKNDAQRLLQEHSNVTHLFVKLDIANFKLLNQMYGYQKGNEVLCAITEALTRTARSRFDINARIASDEFIALYELREADADGTEQAALYETFIRHFHSIVGHNLDFKFHFPHGRYIVYPGAEEAADISDIFEKVNMAHRVAKQDRTKSFVIYDKSIAQAALQQNEIESKMENALQNGEFQAYLQPKYRLGNRTIGGAEALARWQNGNTELFYPGAFIPAFEQSGFITKLDLYMLRKVCNILCGWIESGIEPVVVSVNFSRLHLDNPHFVEDLCAVVDELGVPHRYIEIEITETVIYDNIDKLEILLHQLHAADFTMSMDDFGSGYSSLGMLKNLPVDVIKLDRSFFANPKDAKRSKVVVGSIIEMAGDLGIRIVAEGVETQEHIDLLQELHCSMAQGYFFARPMPEEAFQALLAQQP